MVLTRLSTSRAFSCWASFNIFSISSSRSAASPLLLWETHTRTWLLLPWQRQTMGHECWTIQRDHSSLRWLLLRLESRVDEGFRAIWLFTENLHAFWGPGVSCRSLKSAETPKWNLWVVKDSCQRLLMLKSRPTSRERLFVTSTSDETPEGSKDHTLYNDILRLFCLGTRANFEDEKNSATLCMDARVVMETT